MRGATTCMLLQELFDWNFNPRTPCGVRRRVMLKSTKADLISIHAPRAGCDYATPTESSLLQTISIHAPRAGCDLVIFSVNTPLGISIHAPRAGCDQRASLPDDRPEQFQSTHPVRGATTGDWESLLSINTFQSTHPVRGATKDVPICMKFAGKFQSTHPVRGATA